MTAASPALRVSFGACCLVRGRALSSVKITRHWMRQPSSLESPQRCLVLRSPRLSLAPGSCWRPTHSPVRRDGSADIDHGRCYNGAQQDIWRRADSGYGVKNKTYKFILKDAYVDDPHRQALVRHLTAGTAESAEFQLILTRSSASGSGGQQPAVIKTISESCHPEVQKRYCRFESIPAPPDSHYFEVVRYESSTF